MQDGETVMIQKYWLKAKEKIKRNNQKLELKETTKSLKKQPKTSNFLLWILISSV